MKLPFVADFYEDTWHFIEELLCHCVNMSVNSHSHMLCKTRRNVKGISIKSYF